jgi:hypothetical protein
VEDDRQYLRLAVVRCVGPRPRRRPDLDFGLTALAHRHLRQHGSRRQQILQQAAISESRIRPRSGRRAPQRDDGLVITIRSIW